jgi:N-acetylmuramic acid 6-phosphate (MurNAc-6-P) etherase
MHPGCTLVLAQAQKAIKATAEAQARVIKMLLLGAGESGKSTIFKQMKIVHKDGFSVAERKGFVGIIFGNVISGMHTLLEAFEKIEYRMPDDVTVGRLFLPVHSLTSAQHTLMGLLWDVG